MNKIWKTEPPGAATISYILFLAARYRACTRSRPCFLVFAMAVSGIAVPSAAQTTQKPAFEVAAIKLVHTLSLDDGDVADITRRPFSIEGPPGHEGNYL
jgi:hypothetical protein